MKKTAKILISILLLVSIAFSFNSCALGERLSFDGRNDPYSLIHHEYKVYWVETYDEMLDILSKMKAAGTDTPKIPAFNCDEFGIDVKFRIEVHKSDIEKLKDGEEYYDRRLEKNFSIQCYIFLDDIDIQILKAYIDSIPSVHYYVVKKYNSQEVESFADFEDLKIHKQRSDGTTEFREFHIYYNGKNQFYIKKYNEAQELTEEQIEILKKTVVVIE